MEIKDALIELSSINNIKFLRLLKITETFFGKPRNSGTSHYAFRTPWRGEPRINLQKDKGGKAKPYQVKQVRSALIKLQESQK